MTRACFAFLVVAVFFAACRTPSFQPGEPCINDDDCQTGACIAQVCGFPARTGDPYVDAGEDAADAASDGAEPSEAATTDASDAACEACP